MKKTIIFTLIGIIVITCLSGLLAMEIMNNKHKAIEQTEIQKQAGLLQDKTDTCWVNLEDENEVIVTD